MSNNEHNLYEQIRDFDPSKDDLFYDWFCSDAAIPRKSVALMKKVKQIAFSKRFDLTKTYTFFKNNCPLVGGTYDDFRICNIEDGNVLFTIVPKCSHSGKAEVWGTANSFSGPIVAGTWKDIVEYFNG